MDTLTLQQQREQMVERQLRGRGIRSQRVLDAMLAVPRHEFVPADSVEEAYADEPLPIGIGQTISQPLIVAAMTEAIDPEPGDRVLEIGTGSGYQTAVLAELAGEVFSVEFRPLLARTARERLERLGYRNVQVREGDGGLGWPVCAPFDAILVTAAALAVPPPLVEQLKDGGRMAIPLGGAMRQNLVLLHKEGDALERRQLHPCRFVPLAGIHGEKRWLFG